MSTRLHRPRLPADALVRALRSRFPGEDAERAVTAAGVEIVGVPVARGQVRAAWDEWRAEHLRTGWWPYVTPVSPAGQAASSRQRGDDRRALEERMATITAQDHDALAASVVVSAFRWAVFESEEFEEEWRDEYDPDRLAPRLAPARAEPLPGVSKWGSGDAYPFGDRKRWLHLVPARGGHELPGLLPGILGTGDWYGYGDRVLTYADSAALLRRWHERWGAEPFFAAGVFVELAVERPPLDPYSAAQAASELMGYCPDWFQDSQLSGDGMARSTVWTLWWD